MIWRIVCCHSRIELGVESLVSDCSGTIFVVCSCLLLGSVEYKQYLLIFCWLGCRIRLVLHHGRVGVGQVLVALGEFAFLLKILKRCQTDLSLGQRHYRLIIVLCRLQVLIALQRKISVFHVGPYLLVHICICEAILMSIFVMKLLRWMID